MARTAYTADNYDSDAVASTLDAPISDSATSFNISPATGWATSNIWAVIDRSDNAASAANKEEHIWIQTNSAGALSGVVRNLGGVGNVEHASGAPIEVIASGVALTEMSRAVAETLGTIRGGAVGDILYADNVGAGSESFTRLAAVATGNVLRSAGTGTAPEYGTVRAGELDTTLSKGDIRTSDPTGGDLYEGREWIRSDQAGNPRYAYDGTTTVEMGRTGAWQTFTPTIKHGGTAITLGSGTLNGTYIRLGRLICFWWEFKLAADTSYGGTGNMTIDLPVAARTLTSGVNSGMGIANHVNGGAFIPCAAVVDTTARIRLIRADDGTAVTHAAPAQNTNDSFSGFHMYEAAS